MGQPVAAAAHAPLADALFALTPEGNILLQMPLDAPGRVTAIDLPIIYGSLTADPKGRLIALLAADGKRLSLFETAGMRLRWTIDVPDPVVEMLFSDNFLYLMHSGQSGVTRVTMDPQGGAPGLAAIAAGVPSDVPQTSGALAHMARIPGAGVMVASSRERVGYMISEDGAQAAMSSLPLRAGLTQGIALRLRSPVPTGQKGQYAARFAPRWGGKYLAVAQIDSPNAVHCAPFVVSGPADPALRAAAASSDTPLQVAAKRDGSDLRVTVTGLAVDLVPLRAVLVAAQGNWRRMLREPRRIGIGDFAYPLGGVPSGTYRLFLDLEAAGTVETDLALSSPVVTGQGHRR
jgi:hypothetical protein